MITCPILSQSRSAEDGAAEWQHHECLREGCTFWATEAEDCALRASGIQILRDAAAGKEKSGAATLDPAEFVEAVNARFEALERRVEEQMKDFADRSEASSRDLGLRLLEGVAGLEQPIGALREESASVREQLQEAASAIERVTELIEEQRSRGKDLAAVTERAAAALEERRSLDEDLKGVMDRTATLLEEQISRGEALAAITEKATAALEEERSRGEDLQGVAEKATVLIEEQRSRGEALAAVTEKATAMIEQQRAREDERAEVDRRNEARTCNSRGLALFQKGMHEAAEAAFRRAVELEPSMAEAHNNLGLVLGKEGRSEEAQQAFERALEIRPDLPSALNNLGFLCHEVKEFEKAAEYFRRATLATEDASVAYTNLGNALYRMERRAEAVEAWQRALEKDPLNENAARALKMFEGVEACA